MRDLNGVGNMRVNSAEILEMSINLNKCKKYYWRLESHLNGVGIMKANFTEILEKIIILIKCSTGK